jgi:branched-chain amino acid transport system permease protein
MISARGQWWIPALIFAVFAAAPLVAQALGAGYWVSLLTRIMILAIATLSLDLVLGIGGMVSFGHAAFVGIGAYMAGILIQEGFGDVLIALPVTMVCCAFYGAFSGAISLRTRGVAFIMITLAFGQMAYFFAQALYRYGGDDGLTLTARLTVAGLPLFENRMAFYYIVLGLLILSYLFISAIAGSRFGRALIAARDNEVRAASLGYDVFRIRLTALILSGIIAGIAGLLLANHTEFVSPAYTAWQRSGEFIFMAIIGGLGSLWGAIVGTAAFLLIEEGLSGLTEHWKAIFGPLVILFVLFTRGGLSGLADRVFGPRRDGAGGGHG